MLASSGFQADVRALQKVLAAKHLVCSLSILRLLEDFIILISLAAVKYVKGRVMHFFIELFIFLIQLLN